MNTPIILICGAAGSGKDTVAGFIQKYTKNTVMLAQADPMKRLATKLFGFSEQQLWGPSECRNAPDEKDWSNKSFNWDGAFQGISQAGPWVDEIFIKIPRQEAIRKLNDWAWNLEAEVKTNELTPRKVLQTLGTEVGRVLDPEAWAHYARKTAFKLLEGGYSYNRTSGLVKDSTKGLPDYVLITDGRFPNELTGCLREGGTTLLVESSDTKAAAATDKAGVSGHASEAFLSVIPRNWYADVIYNNKKYGLLTLENLVQSYISNKKKRPAFSF